MTRIADIQRQTTETDIELSLALDGQGVSQIETGIGFFDHMLTLFSKHASIDLTVRAVGDLHVDAHHTVEDVGICLGQAFRLALGDKRGLRRYGSATVPMDEALVDAAVDFGGRPYTVFNVEFSVEKIGAFDAELVREFWLAAAANARCNLHVNLRYGENGHHIAEGVFKAVARAIRQAIDFDPHMSGVLPTTKGLL